MAKVNLVKSARKDIYQNGKRVQYVSEKGKKTEQTISKIDRTLPRDENDKIFIKKGESYYNWTPFGQSTQYSKTQPRQSQLTGSAFLQTVYSIAEEIEDFCRDTIEDFDDFDDFKETIISQIQDLLDETDEKVNNTPDNLQDGPIAEMLRNRVEELQNWIDEIESIECEEFETDEEDIESFECQEVAITNALDELRNTSYNGE